MAGRRPAARPGSPRARSTCPDGNARARAGISVRRRMPVSVSGLIAAARPAGRVTANAVARPATRAAGPGERDGMEYLTRRLSPPLVRIAATLFTAGVATGWAA